MFSVVNISAWIFASSALFTGLKPDSDLNDFRQVHIYRLDAKVRFQGEQNKPVVEGAGLCPGYTINRAILSDAIALTRGDRYFTHDYTPFNLMAWGFADCQCEPKAFRESLSLLQRHTKFEKDTRVFLDVGTANLNSGVFSDLTKVDPTRHPKDG
ncbi:hypothetical protein K438DRAFT_1953443 [Mycena galopus ATCC 62051]|nr:hypothetical protein K438DRAFT_1953443 [Mycena galopus ATCC 62051]